MKLPELTRLTREDFSDVEGDWVDKLISAMNSFQEQVYFGLNKNLTLSDNVVSQFKELEFTTASDYETLNTWVDIKWSHGMTEKPRAVLIAQLAEKSGNYIKNTTPVSLNWYLNNDSIVVYFIAGLANSKTYKARFLVL